MPRAIMSHSSFSEEIGKERGVTAGVETGTSKVYILLKFLKYFH